MATVLLQLTILLYALVLACRWLYFLNPAVAQRSSSTREFSDWEAAVVVKVSRSMAS